MKRGLEELLSEAGDLTSRRLRRASDWRRTNGGSLERALLAVGAVSEEVLGLALAHATGFPCVGRRALLSARPEVVALLPSTVRRRLRALPFARAGEVLSVASSDPGDPVLDTGLSGASGCEVELFVASDPVLEDLLDHWERVLSRNGAPEEELARPAPEADPFERLALALLGEALSRGASELEVGIDARGGFARTVQEGLPPLTRRLPRAVVPRLLDWYRGRGRAEEPFADPSFPVEAITRNLERRSSRVLVSTALLDRVTLSFGGDEAEAQERVSEPPACRHDKAVAAVFCPRCGAVL